MGNYHHKIQKNAFCLNYINLNKQPFFKETKIYNNYNNVTFVYIVL